MWDVKVGDQVVCIRDDWRDSSLQCVQLPHVQGIYTIRDTLIEEWKGERILYLHFEEVRNPISWYGVEPGFIAEWFRPVRRTDISVLRSLLVNPPKELVHG